MDYGDYDSSSYKSSEDPDYDPTEDAEEEECEPYEYFYPDDNQEELNSDNDEEQSDQGENGLDGKSQEDTGEIFLYEDSQTPPSFLK